MRNKALRYATLYASAFVVFVSLVDGVVRHGKFAGVLLGGIYFWVTMKNRPLGLWYPMVGSLAVAAMGFAWDRPLTFLDILLMSAAAAWLVAAVARAYFERNALQRST